MSLLWEPWERRENSYQAISLGILIKQLLKKKAAAEFTCFLSSHFLTNTHTDTHKPTLFLCSSSVTLNKTTSARVKKVNTVTGKRIVPTLANMWIVRVSNPQTIWVVIVCFINVMWFCTILLSYLSRLLKILWNLNAKCTVYSSCYFW